MSLSGTRVQPSGLVKVLLIALCTVAFAISPSRAQNTPNQSQSQQGSQQQQQTPEAGGPTGDIGPIAVPKKKPEDEKPPERVPKVKNPEEIGTFSLKVDVFPRSIAIMRTSRQPTYALRSNLLRVPQKSQAKPPRLR